MPDWKMLVGRRMRELTDGQTLDAEVAEEFAAHLQDRYEELRSNGLSDEEATATALGEISDRDLQGTPHWEHPRRTRPGPAIDSGTGASWIESVWRDCRYGFRVLLRTPALTAVVVLTLGVGIAANTTAFAVINTLLLDPLPVERASELVTIFTRDAGDPANANARLPVSYANLVDLRERTAAFTTVAGHSAPLVLTLTGRTAPERLFGELVTADYFDTLGIRPYRGRFFLPEEDRTPDAHPVLVLGYAPWQQRFGGSSDIIGHTIEINGTAFTVVGIAPQGFKGLDLVFGPDVWIPAMMTARVVPAQHHDWLTNRTALAFNLVARLRPGRTIAQAQSNVDAAAAQLAREYPEANRDRTVAVLPLSRVTLMGVTPGLAVLGSVALMAVPGLVLLIACSNVASLLLARATERRHEIGVRLALGAARSRVVRQLLTESTILGLVSGVAGLGAALACARVLSAMRPPEYAANLVDMKVDTNVLWFAVLLSALTTVIFGAIPALQSSRANLVTVLGQDTRVAGQHRRLVSIRHALLVSQVALSLMALVTAGLFLRSVQQAYTIDPGFEREHMGVVMLNPGQAGYDRARAETLYRTVRDRVGAIPGVTSVSWATNLPLFTRPSRSIVIEGRAETLGSRGILTVVNTVDVGYFATAGVAVTRGRPFTDVDRSASVPVVVINETLARQYWPGRNPVGAHVEFSGDPTRREIVGVAETVDYESVGERPQPCVYLPLAQNFADAVVLYVRTSVEPGPVLALTQREIRGLDERLDVGDVRTARKIVEQALFGQTMTGGLLGVFGLLALGLASLGMYGVMGYNVSLRRREMGVRLALGADGGEILRLVLRDGLTLVASGLVLGAAAAMALSTVLSKLLHGVGPIDPASFVTSILVLLAVAALACYVPARRASRTDPVTVLRVE